jgi:hypothetical protein
MKAIITLFGTGWVQTLLVSANIVQVSKEQYVGAALVGFFISLVWTLNVKSVAFGGWVERISYSAGAMAGTITGMTLTHWWYS